MCCNNNHRRKIFSGFTLIERLVVIASIAIMVNRASDVELAVDPYFPRLTPNVPAGFSGRTIHAGGRCRVFLDDHVQFLKDACMPRP